MLELILTRGYQDDRVTMGMIRVLGKTHEPIYTLENPWRNNLREQSCIPAGTYYCVPFSGAKYREVYQLERVPDRSYILIHAGNTVGDTKGCILPGMSAGQLDGEPAVLNSRVALETLKFLVGDETFRLHVKDGFLFQGPM